MSGKLEFKEGYGIETINSVFLGSGHRMLLQLSIKVVFEIPNNLVRIKSFLK